MTVIERSPGRRRGPGELRSELLAEHLVFRRSVLVYEVDRGCAETLTAASGRIERGGVIFLWLLPSGARVAAPMLQCPCAWRHLSECPWTTLDRRQSSTTHLIAVCASESNIANVVRRCSCERGARGGLFATSVPTSWQSWMRKRRCYSMSFHFFPHRLSEEESAHESRERAKLRCIQTNIGLISRNPLRLVLDQPGRRAREYRR